MFVEAWFGYSKGERLPANGQARPYVGQMATEQVRGLDVVRLWDIDFPWHCRSTRTDLPIGEMWKPDLSGVMIDCFGITGLERVQLAGSTRWVTQRWLVYPLQYAEARERRDRYAKETWRWA